jgi:hypothetical protein
MQIRLGKDWFETNITLEKEEVSRGMFCPLEDEHNKEAAIKHELLKIIAELVVQYDALLGGHPENCYEGLSFYKFVCEKLDVENALGVIPNDLVNMHQKTYSWLFGKDE